MKKFIIPIGLILLCGTVLYSMPKHDVFGVQHGMSIGTEDDVTDSAITLSTSSLYIANDLTVQDSVAITGNLTVSGNAINTNVIVYGSEAQIPLNRANTLSIDHYETVITTTVDITLSGAPIISTTGYTNNTEICLMSGTSNVITITDMASDTDGLIHLCDTSRYLISNTESSSRLILRLDTVKQSWSEVGYVDAGDSSKMRFLTINSSGTVGGTLGVTGATTLSGTLGVTGITTFTGAVTCSSATACSKNLAVSELTTTKFFTATASCTFNKGIQADDNVEATDMLKGAFVIATSTLGVTGESTFTSAVNVSSCIILGVNSGYSAVMVSTGTIIRAADVIGQDKFGLVIGWAGTTPTIVRISTSTNAW